MADEVSAEDEEAEVTTATDADVVESEQAADETEAAMTDEVEVAAEDAASRLKKKSPKTPLRPRKNRPRSKQPWPG